jgi:hypothetical protein
VAHVLDPSSVGHPARELSSAECAEIAIRAAAEIDFRSLDRSGSGSAELLWRTEHSEAWLNTWWEPRDSGFHDHDGSGGGVYVVEGSATTEGLSIGQPRRVCPVSAGDAFSFDGDAIHRVDHHRGAVTIHVYSPPLRSIGHYDIVDGELHRTPCSPDDASPPSAALTATLG